MKFSIIIPTCKSANLIPCLQSIHKYTDFTDTEVIAVCNGYDGVLPGGCQVIWFDQMIGYPAACNAGIKAAKGEFIVLLNDDTQVLANTWIDMLFEPFSDPQVAITGPWMMHNTEVNREFVCFFCCMIRRSVLEKIGLLDEAFGFGYAEDVDLCCKAVDAGYKIVQVPHQDKLPYDGRMATGDFPMFHAGNKTFENWPGGDKLMAHNHAILRERYSPIKISNAQKLGEWMNDDELRLLGRFAQKSKVIIELGSWFGKSSTVLADNLPRDGVLYCVDTWAGSMAEVDTNHADAKKMDGDYAFDQFARNLWPHIASGKLRPIRMHGVHAARLFLDMGLKADLIFIDAGHTCEEVKADIHAYAPLMNEGGIICGHDCYQPAWPGVTEAVTEIFGQNFACNPGTHIWSTDFKPTVKVKDNVFDCFLFNNELDMLELRFKRLFDAVDRFVIVEAPVTFSGKPKELVFHNNLSRFQPYLSKVTYIVVEDLPQFDGTENSAWAMEQFQREAIMRGLKDCKDSDIIISGDVDEIPTVSAIHSFNGQDIASFEMDLFIFDYSVKAKDPWLHCKIARYRKLKEMGVCFARYSHDIIFPPRLKNGGEHLSYFGGVETVIQKIHNTPHRNIDRPEFTDPEHIKKCMENGLDLFGRDIQYEVVT